MKKRFWINCSLGLLVLLFCATELYAETWKYAIEVVEGDVEDIYAKEFKRRIEEKTNGDIHVTVYPFGTLGEAGDLTELTAEGVIQFSNASPGHLGTFVPEVQICSIPFMMSENPAVNKRLMTGSTTIYQDLAKDFEKHGIKLLTLYPEGNMVWTTSREIHTIKDFDGFKMRVLTSPIMIQTYKDFGADPTPLPFGEVYGALQLKQVDGMVNPISSIYAMKFYEVTPILTWPGHKMFLTTIVTNPDWFRGQTKQTQALITQTFAETTEYIIDKLPELESGFVAKIKKERLDVSIVKLTAAEREPFREASMKTRKKYVELVGARGQKIMDSFLAERHALEQELGEK